MMKSLLELWSAATAPINLPFTVLLSLVLAYWGLVIIGVFGIEGGDDAALDTDVGAETDVDGSPENAGIGLHGVLEFLNAGDVPIMVVVSFISLAMWVFAVLSNYYLNPAATALLALALFIPNLLASALVTRYLTKPLKRIFAALNRDYDDPVVILGQVCTVLTGEVTPEFGQGQIETKGAPITIQIRMAGPGVLHRGEQALVVEKEPDRDQFKVIKFQATKPEESLCR